MNKSDKLLGLSCHGNYYRYLPATFPLFFAKSSRTQKTQKHLYLRQGYRLFSEKYKPNLIVLIWFSHTGKSFLNIWLCPPWWSLETSICLRQICSNQNINTEDSNDLRSRSTKLWIEQLKKLFYSCISQYACIKFMSQHLLICQWYKDLGCII